MESTKSQSFFKSSAFKCIIVLLSIALICSGLLAILNNVLAVSDEERTSRAVAKIYGEEKQLATYEIDESISVAEYGTIDAIYKIENSDSYDLLFKTTGANGYKNGTITLWTQVQIKDKQAKIMKVVLESYDKQTLMSKLSDSYYNSFIFEDGFYSTDKTTDKENIVSGATKSSNASSNAINCVIKYVQGELNK